MKIKNFILVFMALSLMSFQQGHELTVFMIGDSTMANKSLDGGNPERGWGQMFGAYFPKDVRVANHAVNGRSSKSFIDENRWDEVLAQIKPGDYVFIQFGHNDQKEDAARHTDPGSTFDANLKRFIHETRAKKGIPVLFTSIVRRHFNASGQLTDTHGTYVEATKRVAKETSTTLIDLNKLTHTWVEEAGDIPSRDFFMWVKEQSVPACPEGKKDNTHLNIKGARIVAGMVAKALQTELPDLARYVHNVDFVVAKDGSGDFFTIQEAINAVPDYRKEGRTRILIRQGVYYEKLIVAESKINVSLIGEEGTVISYDDFAAKKNSFGENKSTSGSSTVYFYGNNLYAEGITFENTSGPVGQAVACFVSGDRTFFKQCRFLGFQDTLYTYGDRSRQYYEDCYIEGTVDFIFGWSTAVFNRCTIHSKGKGYITAPSTPEGATHGYVFLDCMLTAEDDVGGVYLSRPWRSYAKAVFIRCELGKHIHPAGWHNWGKEDAERTVFFAEFENSGSGAATGQRAPFAQRLESIEAYSIPRIVSGNDNWNPLVEKETLLTEKK